MGYSLIQGFIESARRHPDRVALNVDEASYKYSEMSALCNRVAEAVRSRSESGSRVAILTRRSLSAYVGIAAAVRSGRAYVPLNAAWPPARQKKMLTIADCDTVVVDEACAARLPALLPYRDKPVHIIYPTAQCRDSVADTLAGHHHSTWQDFDAVSDSLDFDDVSPESICYLIFTSGTTGEPKAVMVSHQNVMAFLDNVKEVYPGTPEDRYAACADISFDPSVHDIFSPWQVGASIYAVPPAGHRIFGDLVKKAEITTFTSVPSISAYMIETDSLRPGSLPSLKWVTFGGEGVSLRYVQLWQAAAPNAEIGVLYGPTEATVACTYYAIPPNAGEEIAVNGIMPIGFPLGRTTAMICDSAGAPLPDGEPGELCIGGGQVAAGYLHAPEKTAEKFVELTGPEDGTWYKTGDRALRNSDGLLVFLGRFDNQTKIHGYRVELSEIETLFTQLAQCNEAAAIPWPVKDGIAEGVQIFAVRDPEQGPTLREIIRGFRQHFPSYMVPRRVYFIDAMPLTATGKTDRKKLTEMLEAGVVDLDS